MKIEDSTKRKEQLQHIMKTGSCFKWACGECCFSKDCNVYIYHIKDKPINFCKHLKKIGYLGFLLEQDFVKEILK